MHSFRSGAHTEYSTDIILCVVINQVVQGELVKGGIRSDKCIRNYTHVDTKLHIYRVRFILDQQWGFLHSHTGGCIFFGFSPLCVFSNVTHWCRGFPYQNPRIQLFEIKPSSDIHTWRDIISTDGNIP